MEPTGRDLEALQSWWTQVLPMVPEGVKGLWFGITDLAHGDDGVRTLYVAGCPTFDASDTSGEWATDYCWLPSDRYVTLPDFATLPSRPYQDVLTYAVGLVRTLTPSAAAGAQGAAVGFDDGDFVIL